MSLLSKHRLWLTINGLCSIPEVSNREIMIYTLNSLNNNVYKIKETYIPELVYIDTSINDQLLSQLYYKYISAIKETEDKLADMIINDLLIQYTPVITESFSYTLMYGGGDGPSKGPPGLVSKIPEKKSEIVPGSYSAPETAHREDVRRQQKPGPLKQFTNFIGRTMFSRNTDEGQKKETRIAQGADKPPGKVYKTHTVAPPGGFRTSFTESSESNKPPPKRIWTPSEVSDSGFEPDEY